MASTRASISTRSHPPHFAAMICSLLNQNTVALQALWRGWFDHHDVVAAGRLVNAHLSLVADIAGEYCGDETPSQELIAEGYVGLMRALCRYDPDWDVDFAAYASLWIRGAIQRNIPDPPSAITSNTAALPGSSRSIPSHQPAGGLRSARG